ncbi:hypothetical protein B0H14DRAFT_3537003 [Mycena olivaceomarginata]|nr:hypothetical protein B0H14DRAFT_3537003 [Mycena olivaceomarginata]
MARRTRSGAQWSPWVLAELSTGPLIVPPRVQIVRAPVSLAPYLRDAMDAAERRANQHDTVDTEEDDEWEDEDPVLSRPATPISHPPTPLPPTSSWSRSPSPLSDLPPSPSPSIGASPTPDLPLVPNAPAFHCLPAANSGRLKATGFGPVPQARHSQDYRQEEAHPTTCRAARDLPVSAGGNWTGPRASKKARLSQILSSYWMPMGALSQYFSGRPEGDDWDDVIAEMERVMDRGNFYVLKGGLTKGPGQKKPGNLALPKEYRRLLELIASNPAIRRITGFQSSGLARYLPKSYQYYKATMQSIFEHQPELVQLFPNSHLDMLNFAYGMCAMTSGGRFNHKLSGHIYIDHLKTVCEFPSGATVLLLSGRCHHGNTPIARHETRYSMTQYAAGALFQWVAYGHQSVKSLLAQKGGAAKKAEIDGEAGARAEWALGLLSKADELDADRAEPTSDAMDDLPPPAMGSPPRRKKRLFSPKPETRTIFKNFPSEIIRDAPGFHTDQETTRPRHRRMIFQIALMDELIARTQSDREKARARLRRERKEAQDRVNAEAWQLAHPPPPPTLRIVHRHGWRAARQEPLEEEDLYLDDACPGDISLFYAEEDDLNDGSDSDDSQDGYVPRARARQVHYIPEERITVASDGRLNSTMSSIPTPASPAKKSRVTLKPDVPAGPAFSPQEWEADFAEFDAEFGPGMQTSGPRKLRDSDDPHGQWARLDREDFLDELLRHDGRGDHVEQTVWAGVGCDAEHPSYRCTDCMHSCLYCGVCVKRVHAFMPFHQIERWENDHFHQCTLKSLGVRIQLGH